MSPRESAGDRLDTWIHVALSGCLLLLVLSLFVIVLVMGWKELTR